MRGSPHHHRWQAGCDHQLQDVDLDAGHHLDQHFLLHSDFDQQALHDFFQVIVDQLPQDHFFEVDLDSLQLHQDFLDQLKVHDIVQVVDQLQVHHFFQVDQLQVFDFFQVNQLQVHHLVQAVQHTLHHLFVHLGQASRVKLDILQVHKQQARHLVLPCFDFNFPQLDLHHRDCAQPRLHHFGSQFDLSGLARHRHFVVGLPLFRPHLRGSTFIFEHLPLLCDCWFWPPNPVQQVAIGVRCCAKLFEEHLRFVHTQDHLHRLPHQADSHAH